MNILYNVLAFSGEQLDLVFGGFVGAQQTISGIVAAAINRSIHNVIQTANNFSTSCLQNTFSSYTSMNIAGKNAISVVQDSFSLVSKNNLNLSTCFFNQVCIIFYIVNTSEFVLVFAKQLTIFFQCQYIAVRIDACFIQLVIGQQCITNLVARIAEH